MFVQAQESITNQIKKSSLLDYKKKHLELDLVDSNDDFTVIVKYLNLNNPYSSTKKYTIEVFNNDLKLINTKNLKTKKYISELIVKNDSIFLFENSLRKSLKTENQKKVIDKVSLMAYVSSINKLDFKIKPHYEIKSNDLFFDFKKMSFSSPIQTEIIISNNKEYELTLFTQKCEAPIRAGSQNFDFIESDFKTSEEKTYSQVYRFILRKKDHLLYTKNVIINHGSGWPNFYRLRINDINGDIMFLETEQLEPTKFFNFKNYRLYTKSIIRVNKNNTLRKNIGAFFNNKYLGALDINFHKNYIYLTGLYASDEKQKKYEGFAKAKIDVNNLNLKNTNLLPFSQEFHLDRLNTKKANILNVRSSINSKDFENKYDNIYTDKVFFDEDDNCIINMNEYYYGINSQYKKTHTFAITAKISNDNKLLWSRAIYIGGRKFSKQTNSFTSYYSNNKNFILFNQKESYLKFIYNKNDNRSIDNNQTLPFVAIINNNGDLNFSNLSTSTKTDYLFESAKRTDNQLFFYNRNSKKGELNMINFKQKDTL
ncbi:hypothetical protein AXE80_05465 [Wenyingzhuangia fucanilytica]|uniref:Uncharacterized protein n=2 Tax=Wenyingzhuangia fucanilytica TaxID=1790137 RepID=A0A1B1Y4T0_9FLAO|nr:hypothetical protein AXE80_05465 [Wenyingzhuangia fucanilytica]